MASMTEQSDLLDFTRILTWAEIRDRIDAVVRSDDGDALDRALNSIAEYLAKNLTPPTSSEYSQTAVFGELLRRAGERLAETAAWTTAAPWFEAAVGAAPDNGRAWHRLGNAYRALGRNTDAIAAYRRAIDAAGPGVNVAVVWRQLGNILLEFGETEEARQAYRTSLEIDPTDAAALDRHESMCLLANDVAGALAGWDRTLAVHPNFGPAILGRIDLLHETGALTAAEAYEAILDAPPAAEVHYRIGEHLRRAQDFEGAIGRFETAITLAPDLAVAYLDLGQTLAQLGRDEQALDILHRLSTTDLRKRLSGDLRKHLDAEQQRAMADYEYALVLERMGRIAEAEAPARRVIEATYKFADYKEYLALLGRILQKLGKHDEAADLVARAKIIDDKFFALDPRNHSYVQQDRARLSSKSRLRNTLVQWPLQFNIDRIADLDAFVRGNLINKLKAPPPFIEKDTHIFTYGSCFAENIVTALLKYNVTASHLSVAEDVNTTFANRDLFKFLNGEEIPAGSRKLAELYGHQRDGIVAQVTSADVVIATVGVAPAAFQNDGGDYVFKPAFDDNHFDDYTLRTSTVQENRENIVGALAELRKLNPTAPVFLTVSPIPLRATLDMHSAIMADCVSKSVLRAAVHEVMSMNLEGVYYWPTFEIIRWLGSHRNGAIYGDLDQRHVNRDILDMIMRIFLDRFGGTTIALRTIED